jgi:hypothetical protein
VREKETGERRPKDFPRKGNPKAFSSTHHATKEKKETSKNELPVHRPIFDYCETTQERTYTMIERERLDVTRSMNVQGRDSRCWESRDSGFLLYYT